MWPLGLTADRSILLAVRRAPRRRSAQKIQFGSNGLSGHDGAETK